ncbi:hypothetical protein ACFPOB_16140 [Bosea eneae]|uniref:Uncharacterized protein n=1 Tax=Bosea eneae TaxID=151454 RepID=A0ABW0IVC2_9HYPH
MADNSQQILDEVVSQQRSDIAPTMSEQDFFEIFCSSQILKDFDLSYDEIESGIVDGEHDGGIDAVYSFVNGELVYEDFDTTPFKKDVVIEMHIIQSKTSGGFSEVPIDRMISLTRNLLRLDADYNQLTQYNSQVKEKIDCFRTVLRRLASRFPTLKLSYYYASRKADAHIHQNLEIKAQELKSTAESLFDGADVSVNFLGARKLLELARRRPKTTYEIRLNKSLRVRPGTHDARAMRRIRTMAAAA